MRNDEREHARGDDVRGEPAEPAKVHGDVLEDLIPRDLRETDAGEEAHDDATRARRERSPTER